jgi:hypothetical protein
MVLALGNGRLNEWLIGCLCVGCFSGALVV